MRAQRQISAFFPNDAGVLWEHTSIVSMCFVWKYIHKNNGGSPAHLIHVKAVRDSYPYHHYSGCFS